MKSETLHDAIGMISDDHVAEAHPEAHAASPDAAPSSKRRWKPAYKLALAACLILLAGVGALAVTQMGEVLSSADEAVFTSAVESDTLAKDIVAAADYEDAMPAAETNGSALLAADGEDEDVVEAAMTDATTDEAAVPAGEAFKLTAAEWNDNDNWPFFTNLVNSGTISFPAYGIDPRNRVKVTVTDDTGAVLAGQDVELLSEDGTQLWRARTNRAGVAYLFAPADVPAHSVSVSGTTTPIAQTEPDPDDPQGAKSTRIVDDVTIVAPGPAVAPNGLQVMFIVDTTGSMSDEIAYLQKDFASIAAEVGSDGIEYATAFYRDHEDDYVTRLHDFTSDVAQVQSQINAEYADGGGDEPEAVADILDEAIGRNTQWRDDAAKVAFLIFDAPPHTGTEPVIDAAVRSAAARGIHMVPVVASNADRDTELFGRALAICTGSTYVFLTDDSGIGGEHLEPIVGDYTVELLHDVIVRIINEERG